MGKVLKWLEREGWVVEIVDREEFVYLNVFFGNLASAPGCENTGRW